MSTKNLTKRGARAQQRPISVPPAPASDARPLARPRSSRSGTSGPNIAESQRRTVAKKLRLPPRAAAALEDLAARGMPTRGRGEASTESAVVAELVTLAASDAFGPNGAPDRWQTLRRLALLATAPAREDLVADVFDAHGAPTVSLAPDEHAERAARAATLARVLELVIRAANEGRAADWFLLRRIDAQIASPRHRMLHVLEEVEKAIALNSPVVAGERLAAALQQADALTEDDRARFSRLSRVDVARVLVSRMAAESAPRAAAELSSAVNAFGHGDEVAQRPAAWTQDRVLNKIADDYRAASKALRRRNRGTNGAPARTAR